MGIGKMVHAIADGNARRLKKTNFLREIKGRLKSLSLILVSVVLNFKCLQEMQVRISGRYLVYVIVFFKGGRNSIQNSFIAGKHRVGTVVERYVCIYRYIYMIKKTEKKQIQEEKPKSVVIETTGTRGVIVIIQITFK